MKFAFATANLKIDTLRMRRRFARVFQYNGSVSVRYNSLFISLLLFTKVHKEAT